METGDCSFKMSTYSPSARGGERITTRPAMKPRPAIGPARPPKSLLVVAMVIATLLTASIASIGTTAVLGACEKEGDIGRFLKITHHVF